MREPEIEISRGHGPIIINRALDQRILRYPRDKSGFPIGLPAPLLERIGLRGTFESFALYKRNNY